MSPEAAKFMTFSLLLLWGLVLEAPRDDAAIMVKWLNEHAVEI